MRKIEHFPVRNFLLVFRFCFCLSFLDVARNFRLVFVLLFIFVPGFLKSYGKRIDSFVCFLQKEVGIQICLTVNKIKILHCKMFPKNY